MILLSEVLHRPLEERGEFLRAQCKGDQKLYAEVLEGVYWEERMGSFLLEPLLDLTTLIRPFEPGDTVAERFTIVREIGEGGMGVVYEARDRKRNTPIAIKAAKPGFQRLLSPELEGALKVRHHNVCLVNEIHTAQTQHGPVDFLSMELLKGQTLSAHLAKLGKLEHKEALDIACQLCAGLAEAHDSGVLHRDLKTSNVLLCENDDGTCRAVITDFGLASCKGLESAESGGTPGYMAPELWDGAEATKASDIYALGVILYEMVAGIRPDESHLLESNTESLGAATPHGTNVEQERPSLMSISESDWNRIAKAGSIQPPSKWTKGLDHRWDRVITRCLATAPADRPQDAHEVLAELKREPIPKWPFALVGVLVLLLTAVLAFVRPARQWAADLIWPPNVRLAVLSYEGPEDLAAIGKGALQEVAQRVEQLPGGRRTLIVLPASPNIRTPQQARDGLHATHALKLTLQHDASGAISAKVIVVDLSSKIPLKELSSTYKTGDIGAIPTALTGLVAQAFRLREASADDMLAPAANAPYLRGCYLLNRDVYSFDEALAEFQQAARLDPNSALPPAGIALALVQKFQRTKQKIYLDQAQRYLRTARSRSPDSVRVLLAAGTLDSATGRDLEALRDFQRIQELDPRNVDAVLGLATTYEVLRDPDQALAAYRKAKELDPEYYRPYHLMGGFYTRYGRHEEAADQFRKMIERAPGLPDAYSALGSSLLELRQYSEAEAALQESLKHGETAQALNNLGVLRSWTGHYADAAAYLKRALTYEPDNFTWLTNVADNLRWSGQAPDARINYHKAREGARLAITLNPQSGRARSFFAYLSCQLGEKDRAADEIKQAINLQPGENENLVLAIWTYECLGERSLALDRLREMTPAQAGEICTNPDLADFCRDSRFKEDMKDKGGQ